MATQNAGKIHTVFSVISIIVVIIGFIFSFIQYFGAYAIYESILCGIGISIVKKVKAGKRMALAGIV